MIREAFFAALMFAFLATAMSGEAFREIKISPNYPPFKTAKATRAKGACIKNAHHCFLLCLGKPKCQFVNYLADGTCYLYNVPLPEYLNDPKGTIALYARPATEGKVRELARGKPVKTSSSYSARWHWSEKVTNDGNMHNRRVHKHCWCSYKHANSYLRVDLKKVYTITKVVIYGTFKFYNFSRNYNVYVGNNGNNKDKKIGTMGSSPTTNYLRMEFKAPANTKGRYVTMFRAARQYLCACHIQVFGY